MLRSLIVLLPLALLSTACLPSKDDDDDDDDDEDETDTDTDTDADTDSDTDADSDTDTDSDTDADTDTDTDTDTDFAQLTVTNFTSTDLVYLYQVDYDSSYYYELLEGLDLGYGDSLSFNIEAGVYWYTMAVDELGNCDFTDTYVVAAGYAYVWDIDLLYGYWDPDYGCLY